MSRQFWSHLVREGLTGSPKDFITPVPHVSFVTGEDGRAYMRARHEALAREPLFAGLEYTEDAADALAEWLPLVMAGRDPAQVVAATRSIAGTDVNFGALTRLLFDDAADRGVARALQTSGCADLTREHRRPLDGRGAATPSPATRRTVRTRFVFVGAGGGALPLLQRAGHPGDPRLRRLPGQRQVPAHHLPRARQPAPGQGLRPGRRRRPAHVGAAPGPAADRRRRTRCCSARTPASRRSSSRPARLCDLPAVGPRHNLGSMLGVAQAPTSRSRTT